MNKTPWILVAVLASVALSLHIPPAAAGDSAYLKVSVNRELADTYSFVEVSLESKTWLVNGTGLPVLGWSSNAVNVILLSEDDQLIVGNYTVYLGDGHATLWVTVKPEWTETLVNVTATDPLSGLVGYATFYTEMSDEYFVWMNNYNWYLAFQRWTETQLENEGREDFAERTMLAGFAAAWAFLWVMVFIRLEHRLARSQKRDSLWDRFCHKYFNVSLADEETHVWLDLEKTWDKPAAEFYDAARRMAAARNIDSEIKSLQREKLEITGGQVEIQG